MTLPQGWGDSSAWGLVVLSKVVDNSVPKRSTQERRRRRIVIRIQSSGGPDLQISAVFVCDVCKEPITDIRDGVAVQKSLGQGEDELYDVLHAHKGACDGLAVERLGARRSGPWFELRQHLNQLVLGMHVSVRDMINQEPTVMVLTPSQYKELQDRITDIGEWLEEHGIESSLFN
jgi:hypothetical protein